MDSAKLLQNKKKEIISIDNKWQFVHKKRELENNKIIIIITSYKNAGKLKSNESLKSNLLNSMYPCCRLFSVGNIS